ncbi:pyridoxamine 5'-phosphate oxidase family protein [Iamia majanohamensis]|uniref:Pyridoxamine 5'-phosphate oxidase family protein n=1 Tax=Iamia majanohamensis TaxID=467976 RepID=A0AAE9YB01_9ACTN|nr:MSMEG_1061 family FMN-dependent PPOX-type flavoprotein [Iamia majanohamensis]WCO65687.1 pyridoxamine 5'-phosphate oxidase family protein [Iamia majanohamensis]
MRLETVDDLRTHYREPGGGAVAKVIPILDHNCVAFLARCPFFVLSTADADGVCDASPKGGTPGFVRALDERHLAWADLSGNNRLDSFENLVSNPRVGILFMIPGMDETLRVNGTAEIRTDPDLCDVFAVDGRTAGVVVVVTVEEAYIHCAKALRRSALWSPDAWPDLEGLPTAGCMLREHADIDAEGSVIDAALDEDAKATLWRPGGAEAPA